LADADGVKVAWIRAVNGDPNGNPRVVLNGWFKIEGEPEKYLAASSERQA
jgi:hypothetical protein